MSPSVEVENELPYVVTIYFPLPYAILKCSPDIVVPAVQVAPLSVLLAISVALPLDITKISLSPKAASIQLAPLAKVISEKVSPLSVDRAA